MLELIRLTEANPAFDHHTIRNRRKRATGDGTDRAGMYSQCGGDHLAEQPFAMRVAANTDTVVLFADGRVEAGYGSCAGPPVPVDI